MNTIDTAPQHENDLKLQDFLLHLKEKHIHTERDLLILEMSKKLKLNEDCRFQSFIKHCEQFKSRPFLEEITHFSFDEYLERIRSIVDDLGKEDCQSPQIQELHSVLGMVHTLIIDYAIGDLKKMLANSFSEYFTPAAENE